MFLNTAMGLCVDPLGIIIRMQVTAALNIIDLKLDLSVKVCENNILY